MSTKAKRITSTLLMVLVSLMMLMSGIMKLTGSPQIIEGFTKIGLINFITLIAIIELASTILLLIPKTHKIGFFLLLSYLGGAVSIELAAGQAPTAAVFIAILWISEYLRESTMFLPTPKVSN